MTSLAGKRILVIEDEFLVASLLRDMLAELGAEVVGPAQNLEIGTALAEREVLDAAVLDINIDGERSDSIAQVLMARNIPFVLATGYGERAASWGGVPVVDKPYRKRTLAAALLRAMTASDRA